MAHKRRSAPEICEPGEEWRPIPSYPGYFASSLGRIRGPQRSIIKPSIAHNGYLRMTVYLDGKQHYRAVSCLVCEAFNGPRPTPEHQAAHWDGRITNNAPGNLRWATPKENQEDRKRHGTRLFGEIHAMAKITDLQAEEIREAYRLNRVKSRVRMGLRKELAERFGLNPQTVQNIGNGRERTVTE